MWGYGITVAESRHPPPQHGGVQDSTTLGAGVKKIVKFAHSSAGIDPGEWLDPCTTAGD